MANPSGVQYIQQLFDNFENLQHFRCKIYEIGNVQGRI